MGILINDCSRIQGEPALNGSEVKQPEKSSGAVSTGEASKRTNIVKSSDTSAARRPVRDQYIPEKPGDTVSFGHYRPVKDENGDTRIEFTKPEEGTVRTDGMDKLSKSEQTVGSAEVLEQNQNAAGEQVADKKDSDKAEDSGKEKILGGKSRVQELKIRKKQLERDIKAATDTRTASNLRKKLKQVEKALKAATQ